MYAIKLTPAEAIMDALSFDGMCFDTLDNECNFWFVPPPGWLPCVPSTGEAD